MESDRSPSRLLVESEQSPIGVLADWGGECKDLRCCIVVVVVSLSHYFNLKIKITNELVNSKKKT